MTIDKDKCPHTGGLAREYMFGQNTGDLQCNDCGLAISPSMWAELFRKQHRIAVHEPKMAFECLSCGDYLRTSHSDFQGVGRQDGYCMTCGYESHQVWRSEREAQREPAF